MARVEALTRVGQMRPAGVAAYEARDPARTAIYSYERPLQEFDEALLAEFKANAAAWAFFEAQPPSYRKVTVVVGHDGETRRDPPPALRAAPRGVCGRPPTRAVRFADAFGWRMSPAFVLATGTLTTDRGEWIGAVR